jgi:hypothetical protein
MFDNHANDRQRPLLNFKLVLFPSQLRASTQPRPFKPAWTSVQQYVNQMMTGANRLFQIGRAFHLMNVTESNALFVMDGSRPISPTFEKITHLSKLQIL